MSVMSNASQALAVSLAENPATFTSTPYHGRNRTTKSARPLIPAISSPWLSRDISTDFPLDSSCRTGALSFDSRTLELNRRGRGVERAS